jgi:hypothetical protein
MPYCQSHDFSVSSQCHITVMTNMIHCIITASVVCGSEFLATDPEVPISIPGATRFSEN